MQVGRAQIEIPPADVWVTAFAQGLMFGLASYLVARVVK